MSQPQEMLIYILALSEQPFADRTEPETALWSEPGGNRFA